MLLYLFLYFEKPHMVGKALVFDCIHFLHFYMVKYEVVSPLTAIYICSGFILSFNFEMS